MNLTKVCNKCNLEKELTEFHKNTTCKLGVLPRCKICENKRASEKRFANLDECLTKEAEIRAKNREKITEYKRKSSLKHREVRNSKRRDSDRTDVRKWQENNPEKVKAYKKKWSDNNPHKRAMDSRKRRGVRQQATPNWVDNEWDDFLMSEIYSLARARTKVTGNQWHVDHIVPLISEVVCGLHCPANLRIILAKDNLSKGNKYACN